MHEDLREEHDDSMSRVERAAVEFIARSEQGIETTLDDWLVGMESEEEREELVALVSAARRASQLLPRQLCRDTVIAGRYRILEEIGSGGMGRVFAALDQRLDRKVAVKVLASVQAADARQRALFERESQLLATLHHPGIVTVHESGDDGDLAYIVMNLVEGSALSEVVENARERMDPTVPGPGQLLTGEDLEEAFGLPLGEGQVQLIEKRSWFRGVAAITLELARTLQAAHGAGVVHRDIKPSNVMLIGGGSPVILDFGLAGNTQAVGAGEVTRGLYGSVAYLAPERIQNQEVGADPRSDIYQLGLILYELLTLQRAFSGESLADTLMRIHSGVFQRPRQAYGHVPRDLEAICLKAIELDPHLRYQTATELREDLERYLDGREPQAAHASRLRSAWRGVRYRIRKDPRWTGTLGMLTVALVATVLWLTVGTQGPAIEFGEGLRYPRTTDSAPWTPVEIGEGGVLRPGDSMGVVLEVAQRAYVHGLFVFRNKDDQEVYVCPIPVGTREDGPRVEPEATEPWFLQLREGTHHLITGIVDESDEYEKLLIYASPYFEPALEEWMKDLATYRRSHPGPGVPAAAGFAMIDFELERGRPLELTPQQRARAEEIGNLSRGQTEGEVELDVDSLGIFRLQCEVRSSGENR